MKGETAQKKEKGGNNGKTEGEGTSDSKERAGCHIEGERGREGMREKERERETARGEGARAPPVYKPFFVLLCLRH